MKKLFIVLMFVVASLQALDIDVPTLEEIVAQNKSALKERVILAKYYEKQGNDLKAMVLLKEVLEQEKTNKEALLLKHKIERKAQIREIFREASLTQPITKTEAQKRLQSYYDADNYQFYSNLYQALVESGVTLDDPYHVKAAYIYLWDARYDEAKKALERLQTTNSIDEAKIRADICYYQGKYTCAIRWYEKLYNSSYSLEYAVKLLNSYIYAGESAKAQRLYNYLIRKYPKSTDLRKVGDKLQKIKEDYLTSKKEAYEANPNDATLESYANALNSLGYTKENLALLRKHNETMATPKSLLLEAKFLTWANQSDEALKVLQSEKLGGDLQAKLLLGKIYSWDHKFDESKRYLQEVISKTDDADMKYEAKKALAYVQMWNEEKALAKKTFQELYKKKPHDADVKEALMELNNDYAGLIKIYEKRLRNGRTLEDEKRLANLYIGNKQPARAVMHLKRYVDNNPDDIEAVKALGELLVGQKDYYQGFGYLEYYAAQKHDAKSAILLAKNYYWNGFSKEALDVLDRLLQKEPKNKEALELKAKILKISPRYTTSNSGATIGMYFDTNAKSQLEIADALYFNTHYKASLMYYENYLKAHPTDHKARLRYAYALENAREYGKAEGEFALMRWTQDTEQVRYHYAYNMMKNGKLKEAKKEFLALQNSIYKKLSTNMSRFLKKWEADWESKDFAKYASNYAPVFTKDQIWAYRKQQLFANVNFIAVGVYDPVYKKLPNGHYAIHFFQDYATNKKTDKGYKTLEVECAKGETECRIVKEEWKAGKYEKQELLEPYIDNSLKELKKLEAMPLAQREALLFGKKKILLAKKKRVNTTIFI